MIDVQVQGGGKRSDYITAIPLLVELPNALAMYLAVNYKKLDQAVIDAMSSDDLLPRLDCIKSGRVGILLCNTPRLSRMHSNHPLILLTAASWHRELFLSFPIPAPQSPASMPIFMMFPLGCADSHGILRRYIPSRECWPGASRDRPQ
jgi:hypothetical protein